MTQLSNPRPGPHGQLAGLKEYLAENDARSVLDDAGASGALWNFHIHPGRVVSARLTGVETYDVAVTPEDGEAESLRKHDIHFLYPAEQAAAVAKLVKSDSAVADLKLEPTAFHRARQFVKNKTLFPLMQERTVVFITLRDGSILRGLFTGFSRYDIHVSMKGGVAVTLLRHSLHDIRDKEGRCYLKSVQQQRKDWKKSSVFVTAPE
jgi:sRNA-binding regulator protein Hfq